MGLEILNIRNNINEIKNEVKNNINEIKNEVKNVEKKLEDGMKEILNILRQKK
jgi:hypothetical protein